MRLLLMLLAFCVTPAFGGSLYPTGTAPLGVKNSVGKWVPKDAKAERTKGMSKYDLQILEQLNQGQIPLQLDVTGWEPPAPTTVSQAIWHLREHNTANKVKFMSKDVVLFGLDTVETVDDVLLALARRIKLLEARVAVLEAP